MRIIPSRYIVRGLVVSYFLLIIAAVASSVSSCARANPNLSPAGQRAAQADQVVTRLGELQSVVIDAAQAGKMRMTDAREVVTWISGDRNAKPPVVGAVDVLRQAPAGWQAVVMSGWLTVKPRVLAVPDLSTWAPVIDQLLEGL